MVRSLFNWRIFWAALVHLHLKHLPRVLHVAIIRCLICLPLMTLAIKLRMVAHPTVPQILMHLLPHFIRAPPRTIMQRLPHLNVRFERLLEARENDPINARGDAHCLEGFVSEHVRAGRTTCVRRQRCRS